MFFICSQPKLPLNQFYPYIRCALCCGFLIDATTITECLHTCEWQKRSALTPENSEDFRMDTRAATPKLQELQLSYIGKFSRKTISKSNCVVLQRCAGLQSVFSQYNKTCLFVIDWETISSKEWELWCSNANDGKRAEWCAVVVQTMDAVLHSMLTARTPILSMISPWKDRKSVV